MIPMRLLIALIALLAAPLAAQAQDQARPNTILVLDGSGSMWGQIDGVNKIVIAREVVAEILADFPADQNLGLVTYGHRVRGDCADIETLIAPAPGTAAAIIEAVNDINPRGMTPMTDAVIAAAQALRSTEQAATVILVSDGIETCNPDPCAAARALEEAGVAFTAHVVGFDVGSDPEALAQMQCIADETGGLFLAAADAAELSAAMATVAAAVNEPAPPPDLPTITFRAYLGDETVEITDRVLWDLSFQGGLFLEDAQGAPFAMELAQGDYTLTAHFTEAETSLDAAFFVTGSDQTVTVIFPEAVPEATLTAPDSAPAGTLVSVGWTGPDDQNDNIQVGPPGVVDYSSYVYTRDGNPVSLILPAEPGVYELRYHWRDQQTIATRTITVTEADLALTAPDSAPAGSTIQIGWAGPNAENDNIQIGLPGQAGYSDYVYVRDGNPVSMILPWEPGTYELRYQFRDRETIITRPITVTEAPVSLTAPATAPAGGTVSVTWTGPDAVNDNIQLGSVGGQDYSSYVYTRDGSTVTLSVPGTPGAYELRYHFRDMQTIFRLPITVVEVATNLTAPKSAPAGATIDVGWTGPGGNDDFVGVGRPGESGYLTYAYVRDGNPVALRLPPEAGDYELRYFLGADQSVMATTTITVTALQATVTPTGTARAGQTITVAWTGPGYADDFIGIGRPGEGYVTWARVTDGNPLTLTLPAEAGDYELRYYLGQGEGVLATAPLTVTLK